MPGTPACERYLTKFSESNVQDTRLARRVLPLDEDRALISPFHDTDLAVLVFRHQQIDRSTHAEESRGGYRKRAREQFLDD